MELKVKVVKWAEAYELLLKLARKVAGSGYKPDLIVGISRGGYTPARVLSDLLDVGEVASLAIRFYSDVAEREAKPRVTQPVSAPVRGRRVLLADDVADTGESLKAAIRHLRRRGAAEVRIATMHKKPWSSVTPDYYVEETDAWIVYPWEYMEFCKSAIRRMASEGRRMEEVRAYLSSIGIDAEVVEMAIKSAAEG